LKRITSVIRDWQDQTQETDPAAEYRSQAVEKRFEVIISGLNDFFDYQQLDPTAFQTVNTTSVSQPVSGISRFLPEFVKSWIKSLRSG
jgi:hypothetical protein